MYEIEEFYAVDGQDLKELLKSCIFNYYVKNKDKKLMNPVDEVVKKDEKKCLINMTSKLEILSMEGVNNVQTVQ